jgi:hypothetical protein
VKFRIGFFQNIAANDELVFLTKYKSKFRVIKYIFAVHIISLLNFRMGLRRIKMKKIVLLLIPIFLFTVTVVLAGGRPLSTTLTGEAEVTAAGVPNQGDLDGIGSASMTLNQGQNEICYEIKVSGIILPAAAAHIHFGPSTTTGPVVVPLNAPNADGVSSGCATVSAELIKAIRQNPDAYYVNVHNSAFPGGALRGQLSK